MGTIAGEVDEGYGAVADAFARNFAAGKEHGAAVAVHRDGRLVVDLWGGLRDRERRLAWNADTVVPVFSTTKGMAAAAMAVAHARGLFAYDEPVASYWPEFAQNGKDAITVRQLLAHEAGLAVIDTPLDLTTIADSDALGAVLAAQAPRWSPGSAHGYHAQSLGWYESQLVQRVDPARRSIGRFFADEVAAPLGIEFHIGLPPSIATDRLAVFSGAGRAAAALHAHQMPRRLLAAMFNPRSTTARAFANPRVIAMNMSSINRRDVLEVEFPSMNGVGDARSIATVYGTLASGAAALGVGPATISELEATTASAPDLVLRVDTAFACGFMKPFPLLPFGSSARAYGHTGMGGSFGFADPDLGLGFAYVMNRGGYSLPTDPREIALRTALYESVS